jgi:hypothetical protein
MQAILIYGTTFTFSERTHNIIGIDIRGEKQQGLRESWTTFILETELDYISQLPHAYQISPCRLVHQ